MPRSIILLLACVLICSGGPAAAQDNPTDPKSCATIWSEIGIPDSALANDEDHTIVCHLGYIVGHNSQTKTPDWVIERLTPDLVKGSRDRPGIGFKSEPAVTGPKAVPDDYKKSGYAIGHQAPSADFTAAEKLMRDTFFLSNAVPQIGIGFNTGVWSSLERLVKTLAAERDRIYVITGPVYQQRKLPKIPKNSDACRNDIVFESPEDKTICAARLKDPKAKCEDGVAVPLALYKIIFDPGRTGSGARVNAYLLPNVDHRERKQTEKTLAYLKRYQVSVRTVEELSGYQFFSALPRRKQIQMKEICGATMLR
jgi:DNA/RNA endonuclease G (NUC1)